LIPSEIIVVLIVETDFS